MFTYKISEILPEVEKAINEGNIKEVKELVEQFPDIIRACDKWGKTLLAMAVEAEKIEAVKQLELMKYLIEAGIDIDKPNVCHQTALHRALILERREAAVFLIEQNADVYGVIREDDSTGILDSTIIEEVLKQPDTEDNLELLRLLIKKGANKDIVNSVTMDGTPLFFAADVGQPNFVKLLIEKGADINWQNRFSQTPLHAAVARLGPDMVIKLAELFVNQSVNFNLRNREGKTALQVALERDILNTEKGRSFFFAAAAFASLTSWLTEKAPENVINDKNASTLIWMHNMANAIKLSKNGYGHTLSNLSTYSFWEPIKKDTTDEQTDNLKDKDKDKNINNNNN
ncbi:MAG: ankyrin repeat domain-containing protein [Gammaproteobacteria bacterium]|nr:ankyrin repeat domain-containing protein [Gammaproteobacteria bacterium]